MHRNRSELTQAPLEGRRLAYATLDPGDRCLICHQNPCVGHDKNELLRGLMSAGVIYPSLLAAA